MAKVTVYFHGKLKHFGESVTADVHSYAQLASYLCRAFSGLRGYLKAGVFRFAKEETDRSFLFSTDSNFFQAITNDTVLHLVPAEGVAARRALGIIGLVLGVALVATGAYFVAGAIGAGATLGGGLATTVAFGISAGTFIATGVSIALLGATSLMAPTLGVDDFGQGDRPEERQSSLFTSATNRTARGVAIPVCYGEFLVGSNVISQSIKTVEVL
jgi:predicted phage tail protein